MELSKPGTWYLYIAGKDIKYSSFFNEELR
jgi:hypothetical protein